MNVVTPTIEMNNTISRLHTYVFLSSAEEENIKVDVEMLDSEGSLLKSLSFENVHLKTNYVTKKHWHREAEQQKGWMQM